MSTPSRTRFYALVGQAQIYANVWIAILKIENKATDVQDTESGGTGNSDRARRSATRAPRLVDGLLDEAKYVDAVRVVLAALLGQGHAPCSPAEQRRAQRLLQLPEVTSDARLARADFPCDGGKAATLRHPDESPHTVECDA